MSLRDSSVSYASAIALQQVSSSSWQSREGNKGSSRVPVVEQSNIHISR
jgi:hypothetical protein